ncbi:hypothetical protein DFH11DRAFT_1502254 [Phellopilus nigrolimitatus]|nr:hypothetical protein DFH11DRAFT_1502254 [Phellopilus nigrolimitatus]
MLATLPTADIFFLILSLAPLALGMPSWDAGFGTRPQVSIGNLVPGASVIEAIGEGITYETYKPKYLSVAAPKGVPGSAAIYEDLSPPLFFINNQQLWQPMNTTSILRVNVLNVTGVDEAGQPHPAPLKLEIGERAEGLVNGVWRWRGTKLFFDLGKRSNKGLYFSCQTKNGMRAVYTALDDMPAPPGCKYTTLHSFTSRIDRP